MRLFRRWLRISVAVTGIVVVAILFTLPSCHHYPDQSKFCALGNRPSGTIVQARCAKIPRIELIAAHCWFVVFDVNEQRWHRWEVWQTKGLGDNNWGHVRRDLMSPGSGVGAGDSWALHEWDGKEAQAIHRVLMKPQKYPYKDKYHYWPGPNSNTYVSWILEQTGLRAKLPRAAIGKDYRGK